MSTVRLILWSPSDGSALLEDPRHPALPMITVPASSRVAALAQRWCEQTGIDARVLAVIGAVGRRDGSLDWGVWLRCDARISSYHPLSLSEVERRAHYPCDRRLAGALVKIVDRPQSSGWIGFNPAWPELVGEWISQALGAQCDGDILPLRADATALVTRHHVARKAVFFTARPLPFRDPELCDVLRDHSSSAFPTTLARDQERGWWLTADVGGHGSARYVSRNWHRASRLLEAMANVQVSTLGSIDLQRLSYCVTRETVPTSVARLIESIRDDAHMCDDDRASMLVEVARLWIDVGAEDAPAGWVHSDPSPDNIRVDDDGRLVFLDLEDPWYGPVALMGALAIHSMTRRCRWEEAPGLCAHAWRRYADACGLATDHTLDSWLRLAQLVRLIRRVERSMTESPLLLEEEVPRRSWAIRAELRRLCRH
jgi:Phosphotransferase enzyme family